MEDHRQYLSNNADEDEHRAARQVMEGLAGLRLEAKLKEVAAERQLLERRALWRRIFIALIALALVAGAIYFVVDKKETPAAPNPVPSQLEQPAYPPVNTPNNPVDNSLEQPRPMAQLTPGERLPNPRSPAPEPAMTRGSGGTQQVPQTLLHQIWYTDYPLKGVETVGPLAEADALLKKRDFMGAYLALEQISGPTAANDTTRYLKGYCMLELGESTEALVYFDALQGRHSTWEPQLQWYRGLALLLDNKAQKALALFQQCAQQPRHPYQRQARKAVELLE
jgi:hypothetical protein